MSLSPRQNCSLRSPGIVVFRRSNFQGGLVVANGPENPHSSPQQPGRQRPFISVWQAPLVPAALAVTAGIVLDRYRSIPLPASLGAGLLAMVAWGMAGRGKSVGLGVVYLVLASCAGGAAYHHWHRSVYA